MKLMLVGGGGREHALAWKLAQSPQVDTIFVAPGNGGTEARGGSGNPVPGGNRISRHNPAPVENVASGTPAEHEAPALLRFAQQAHVDLTVVGPEAPLAAGIVDLFTAAGLRCFGPAQAAARLETSKAFAKGFMDRHGIPTARYAVFDQHRRALEHLGRVDYPVVIKASGLAAGKGVIVPDNRVEAEVGLRQMMVERAFGAAGDEVIIEERLAGPEVSLLAFCDGRRPALMPAAQDHKRVCDGDRGPNTGGMGAYAPAPLLTPALAVDIQDTILQPALDGMQAEGTPYVGVLYAGLMLTRDGPRVLEFNCRFGDPETQAILPLLDSDLVDAIEACLDGRLQPDSVRWRDGAAATVVAASAGYPGAYRKGLPVSGVETADSLPDVTVFHAGTRWSEEGTLLTDGGRVLSVTGLGGDLAVALARAYAGMAAIQFEGMHYRRDIGAQALPGRPSSRQ